MLPKIRRILYPTGMGAGAPYVFRYALTMATQHDAEIVVVSAIEPLPLFAQSLVELHVSHQDVAQRQLEARVQAKEHLRERIAKLCEKECENVPRCGNRVSSVQIEEGQPAQIILTAAAQHDADLIIMGSHRHTVVGGALLGTTTTKVLHSAKQPVLVVRIPEGYHKECS
jgi:nucleotide-binding universal stress UspA family protein